ncbi:O-fucosyltransferase family protein [Priestia megaterium]|uniref:O-fucosyltransferase family protein n=1 Tax=Priestia megaterium TaxID=1404 RepID=UPI00366C6540
MKAKLKQLIGKFPRLYYLTYCTFNMNSTRFRERVLEIKTNPFQLHFENHGQLYDKKIIYRIVVGDETKGFCSAIRDTLYYLMYADALGILPYVEYTDNIPYYEEKKINGSNNPFEYYFLQPYGINLNEVNSCRVCANAETVHMEGVFNLYGLKQPETYYTNEPEYIKISAEMYRKYIKLNDKVQTEIDSDIQRLLKNKTIGVHYRGTDFKVGYNGHPTVVRAENHIAEVNKLLKTGRYEYIFLATEDGDVIELFKDEFGDKLLMYTDVVRGTGNTNAYNMKVNRENHHYLLGYEVLRDVYTLAECDAFVSSNSGVGITSQIVRQSNGKNFDFCKVFEEGINQNNNVLQRNSY